MEICVEAVAAMFSVNGINYECDSLTNLVGMYKLHDFMDSTFISLMDLSINY